MPFGSLPLAVKVMEKGALPEVVLSTFNAVQVGNWLAGPVGVGVGVPVVAVGVGVVVVVGVAVGDGAWEFATAINAGAGFIESTSTSGSDTDVTFVLLRSNATCTGVDPLSAIGLKVIVATFVSVFMALVTSTPTVSVIDAVPEGVYVGPARTDVKPCPDALIGGAARPGGSTICSLAASNVRDRVVAMT